MAGMLIDRKLKHQHHHLLTEEKLNEFSVGLQHHLVNLSKCLAQETGLPKGTMRTAINVLNLQPYRTTVVDSFQPHDPVARLLFFN
jgi:hypothetical protein